MADIGLTPNSTIPAKYFEDDAPFEVRITSTKQIGRGGTACVIQAEIISASPAEPRLVALKIFTTAVDSKDEIRLRRELRIVQELSGRHAHIHPFFGLAIYNRSHMILVSPFMKNGDMMNYVKNQPTTPRLPLVLQVAGAVQFLHEKCRLVHGDLKCENVLISDDLRAVLADFGLCTAADKAELSEVTASEIRVLYTVRFAAPELLLDQAQSTSGHVRSKTVQSDVYAFGMLVLQAFTGEKPWPDCSQLQVVARVLTQTAHPHPGSEAIANGFDDRCWEACQACWKHDPSQRPAMREVRDMLGTPAAENDTPESPLHTPVRRTALDTPIAPRTQETNLLNARSLQSGRAFTIALRSGRPVRAGVLELYTGDATMPGSGKQLRVAVKLFPPSEQKEPLWTELKTAAGVRHRNVLPFFGETQFGIQMGVAARYMENGNLLEHLRRNRLLDCRGLILQVTDAVEYLHVNEGIIHGRLKCENVLIADDGTALLCDLGLSSVLTTEPDEASFSLPRQAFQVAFSAPELLFLGEFAGASAPSRPTMPTDVYAFAMLVLQAFTRSAPWGGLSNYAILSRVRQGEVPVRPDMPALSDTWWGVCVRCWSFRADARPTIKDVRRALAADAPGAEDADGW